MAATQKTATQITATKTSSVSTTKAFSTASFEKVVIQENGDTYVEIVLVINPK